ncbi:MAG: ABC transporter permease subunit [Ignavibacteriales bacterium]|nr:ABC transporter permease subunit [Ignavibacteriales bacterium]
MKTVAATITSQLRNIGPIYAKELRSYFNSAVAYVVIVVFLAFLGWFYASNIFLINIASMREMFETARWILLFVIPAITMRLLAEETKSGTIELLTTKPVHDAEIVLGKFFAAWSLIGFALAPTFVYYATIASLGNVDHGPVIGGYLGLLLMAGVYVAVGLFASSVTDNQIVAFILGIFMIMVLFVMDKILMFVPEWLTSVFEYIGTDSHYVSIARGVIDTRDIVYFLSMLGFMLYLSVISLERRKW